jgi:hypothetical protein
MLKRTLVKLAVVVALGFGLSGCGPHVPMQFGIPQAQFQKLTPPQQQNVIAEYNRQQAQKAQDQEVWNLLGAAGSLIHANKTVESSHSSSCSGGTCESSGSNVSVGFN